MGLWNVFLSNAVHWRFPVLYYGPKNAGAAPINRLETKAMVFVVSLSVTDFDLIKCYGFFLIDLDGNWLRRLLAL